MIISHKHKLIFIKPLKVAGTSFELALRDYCGPDDIITPCTRDDEKTSRERNRFHHQNYHNDTKYFKLVTGIDIEWNIMQMIDNNACFQVMDGEVHVYEPNSKRYYNHLKANKIKRYIGEDIFNSYTKVSMIRDPLDYLISNYYFFNVCDQISFREYVEENSGREFDGFFEINNQYIIDHMIRYENMKEDIESLESKIPGLKGLFARMKTFKSKVYRQEKRFPGTRVRPLKATAEAFKKNFPVAFDITKTKFSKIYKKFY